MKRKLLGISLLAASTMALSGCGLIKLISSLKTDKIKSIQEIREKLGDEYCYVLEAGNASGSETDVAHYTYATTSDYFMYINGEDNLLVKKGGENNKATIYNYNVESEGYNSCAKHDISEFENASDLFLTQSQNQILYTSKKSITYLNRPCTAYYIAADIKLGNDGIKGDTETIIDNATGATLSYQLKGEVTSDGETDNGSVSFKVTEFHQGDNVAKNKIDQQVDKITVKEWDLDVFNEVGLSTITKPGTEFFGAEITTDRYSLIYEMKNKEDAKAIMTAFYNAGAKYQSDGDENITAVEDLINEDSDELYFSAYSKKGTNYHHISIAYDSTNEYMESGIAIEIER